MTRLGRLVLRTVRPPGDRRGDERGRCAVCGAETRFALNSWVLPADMAAELGPLADAFRRRETLWCGACGSSLRVRRMADVLLEHYAERAASLAELVAEPGFRELDVAEVNAVGAAHDVLARHPRLRYSEYPEEDLQALSYPDASLDLVLTADTLEHVPDPWRALAEVRRVLRRGGRHVFTVPAAPTRAETSARAGLGASGEIVHHAPAQYHGRAAGPLRLLAGRRADMLAFTDFGLDLAERLGPLGFETEVHFLRGEDPAADAAIVFCARAV
ncbi:MAG TPA: methyltransferase domain-containing protein [Gaiellaceae bacterium]|nr:methyltransferase domain-containing protein [Gaiellaceae bacterium]